MFCVLVTVCGLDGEKIGEVMSNDKERFIMNDAMSVVWNVDIDKAYSMRSCIR